MDVEKIKNFTDEELAHQELQAREQLFRLRFQIRSGQQEGVKKLRELRKDVARMKTVARFRTLYGSSVGAGAAVQSVNAGAAETAAKPVAAKAAAGKAKSAGKKAAAKKTGKKAGPNKTVKKAVGKKASAKAAGKKATAGKKTTGRKAGK